MFWDDEGKPECLEEQGKKKKKSQHGHFAVELFVLHAQKLSVTYMAMSMATSSSQK